MSGAARVVLGLAASLVAVLSACGDSRTEQAQRALRLAESPGWSARETPSTGLVAQLPFVGTLRWRCDDRRRFATSLTLPRRGASVVVTVTTDGNRVWTNKQVDPLPIKRRAETRWATMRRQVWAIRHHHADATLEVVARMSFAIDASGGCLVRHAVVRVRRAAQ